MPSPFPQPTGGEEAEMEHALDMARVGGLQEAQGPVGFFDAGPAVVAELCSDPLGHPGTAKRGDISGFAQQMPVEVYGGVGMG